MPQLTAESTSTDTARERILASAADLFMMHGYAETSVRDIARASGIKAASLYYHSESKDVLLAEILRLGVMATSDAFDASTRACDPTCQGRERLRAAIEAHLSALFEHGPFTSAAVVVFPVAPDSVKELVIPTRDEYERRWIGLLADLAANGDLRADTDLALTRLFLLGALNSTLEWFDVTGSIPVGQLAETVADTFWTGRAA